MKRKVIQLSSNTKVISLPAQWISYNKINKGEELDVEVLSNNIIVSAKRTRNKSRITLNLNGIDKNVFWRLIDAAYALGFDEIEIYCDDPEIIEQIGNLRKFMIGLVVIEERKNYYLLKILVKVTEEEFNTFLKRIFHSIKALILDALDFYSEKNFEALLKIKKRDHMINSYVSYCQRHLNHYGDEDNKKTSSLYSILRITEMISDSICELFAHLDKSKLSKKEAEYINNLSKIFDTYFEIVFDYDQKKIVAFEKTNRRIKNELLEIETPFSFRIQKIIDLMYEAIENVICYNL